MILSPTKGFAFFKPMKTAGSSIEFALALSCGPADLVTGGMYGAEQDAGFKQQNNDYEENGERFLRYHTHTTPAVLKERCSPATFDKIEKLKWITMVRNPWDAVVSYYWWNMKNNRHSRWKINSSDFLTGKAKKKFEDFTFNRISKFPSVYPPGAHDTCTAYEYIRNYNNQFIDPGMQHYITFENLERDFETVVEELGLYNVELPRFKTEYKTN